MTKKMLIVLTIFLVFLTLGGIALAGGKVFSPTNVLTNERDALMKRDQELEAMFNSCEEGLESLSHIHSRHMDKFIEHFHNHHSKEELDKMVDGCHENIEQGVKR